MTLVSGGSAGVDLWNDPVLGGGVGTDLYGRPDPRFQGVFFLIFLSLLISSVLCLYLFLL